MVQVAGYIWEKTQVYVIGHTPGLGPPPKKFEKDGAGVAGLRMVEVQVVEVQVERCRHSA